MSCVFITVFFNLQPLQTLLLVVLATQTLATTKTKRDFYSARALENAATAENDEQLSINDNARFFRRKQAAAAAAAAASVIKDTNQRYPDGSYNYE